MTTFITLGVFGALACAGIFINVPQWVSASGFAVAPEYAEIRAETNGKISKLRVGSNAHVNAGDDLLWISAAEEILTQSIRAPFSGSVVGYSLYVGKPVTPSTLLYEIFNGEVETVKLRIPERYAIKVETGDRVRLEFGTHKSLIPIQFEGEITALRPVIEGDGSRNHQVAYARFDAKGTEILPGTSAEARIFTGRVPLWQYLTQP